MKKMEYLKSSWFFPAWFSKFPSLKSSWKSASKLVFELYCRLAKVDGTCPKQTRNDADFAVKLVPKIFGFFFGPLIFMIELLNIVITYRDEEISLGKSVSAMRSISNYLTKVIPITTFLFIMMGIAFALTEDYETSLSSLVTVGKGNNNTLNYHNTILNFPYLDQNISNIYNTSYDFSSKFRIVNTSNTVIYNFEASSAKCANGNDPWWFWNPMWVGVTATLFIHTDGEFWKNMAKLITNGALKEESLGSTVFGLLFVLLLLVSSLIEVHVITASLNNYWWGAEFIALFGIKQACTGEDSNGMMQISGGFSDILAGLTLIQSFMTVEKFQSITNDTKRPPKFAIVDYTLLICIELIFNAMTWSYTWVFFGILFILSVLGDYNRIVNWSILPDGTRTTKFNQLWNKVHKDQPLNEILNTSFFENKKKNAAAAEQSAPIRKSIITRVVPLSSPVAAERASPLSSSSVENAQSESETSEEASHLGNAQFFVDFFYFIKSNIHSLFASENKKDPTPPELILNQLPMAVLSAAILFWGINSMGISESNSLSLELMFFVLVGIAMMQAFFHPKSRFISRIKKIIDSLVAKSSAKVQGPSVRGTYSDTYYLITRVIWKFYITGFTDADSGAVRGAGNLSGVLAAALIMIVVKLCKTFARVDPDAKYDPSTSSSLYYYIGQTSSWTKRHTSSVVNKISNLMPKKLNEDDSSTFLKDICNKKLTQEDFNLMFFIDDVRDGISLIFQSVIHIIQFILSLFLPSAITKYVFSAFMSKEYFLYNALVTTNTSINTDNSKDIDSNNEDSASPHNTTSARKMRRERRKVSKDSENIVFDQNALQAPLVYENKTMLLVTGLKGESDHVVAPVEELMRNNNSNDNDVKQRRKSTPSAASPSSRRDRSPRRVTSARGAWTEEK